MLSGAMLKKNSAHIFQSAPKRNDSVAATALKQNHQT
jgi:hypothetical protein